MFLEDQREVSNALLREQLQAAYTQDESRALESLIEELKLLTPQDRAHIIEVSQEWVTRIRARKKSALRVETFLNAYPLSSEEGLVLMSLAEALLRIPDKATARRLIRDKIGKINWGESYQKLQSFPERASSFMLNFVQKMLDVTGNLSTPINPKSGGLRGLLQHQVEPIVHTSLSLFMKMLAEQFVVAQSLQGALSKAKSSAENRYLYSFDMLGEAALTQHDADRYFEAYKNTLELLEGFQEGTKPEDRPGISIKLSALHPRYEFAQRDRVLKELGPKLLELAHAAKKARVGMTLDAEEADRLELSLDLLEHIMQDTSLTDWNGLGLAVQAYQKRACAFLDILEELSKRHNQRLMVRLVKGAYWDSEIKRAQEKGLSHYPVFTRKATTDISYLACVKRVFEAGGTFYPQFATHNAHTVAAVLEIKRILGNKHPFEFQKLFGMGDALYNEVLKDTDLTCRIYAPVGAHRDLLPYLVRRLLENGANSSFVHKLEDPHTPLSEVTMDPLSVIETCGPTSNPKIPLPHGLYQPARKNSKSIDLAHVPEILALKNNMNWTQKSWPQGISLDATQNSLVVSNPSAPQGKLFTLPIPTQQEISVCIDKAQSAQEAWGRLNAEDRAKIIDRAGDLLEERMPAFMALLVKEAGKTLPDSVSEVREAIDFCRYYAAEARRVLAVPQNLPGPTGETNQLFLRPRGIFACISPWNFPLAIFLGEVVAALVTGNAVLAKPSRQTPMVAFEAVQTLYDAGVPRDILHFLPISAEMTEKEVLTHPALSGVVFTGSTGAAHKIAQTLLSDNRPLLTFIAETGGLNAMIVDSSALPEQVVKDVIISAFQSAGQRCSALRLLCLQDDVFNPVMEMLKGALSELQIGDPKLLSTDIGPVIDEKQKKNLENYIKEAKKLYSTLYEGRVARHLVGHFVAPHIFEIGHVQDLKEEVFGPVLHVVRFKSEEISALLQDINKLGFGLTLGVQSRLDSLITYIKDTAHVGNIYANRSMIGAVVGVQPFGGEGMSGTGPKAGGPFYLPRFCVERTVTINTTAWGGNASLLTGSDKE